MACSLRQFRTYAGWSRSSDGNHTAFDVKARVQVLQSQGLGCRHDLSGGSMLIRFRSIGPFVTVKLGCIEEMLR